MHALINPLSVFIGTWAVVFLLYSWHISDLLEPLSSEFIATSVGLAVFSSCCFLASLAFGKKSIGSVDPSTKSREEHLYGTVRNLFLIAACLFTVTFISYGGVPLLWIFIGSGKTYTEFGFPTIHGFFNSLLLITGTMAFWMTLNSRNMPNRRFILAFCIAVPIITLHRQSMVSLMLQCLFVFAALRRGSALRAVRGVLGLLLFCGALFSVLGNIRTGDEALAGQAALSGLGEELPLPVIWLYMYLTTPLSNFYDLTTMTFTPTYGGTSLSGLTPTIVREALWGEPSKIIQSFSERTFNSSSYAFILFLDCGWMGVYVFTGLVIGYGGVLYRRYISRPTLYNLLNLCVLNHVVFLFVFANFLLSWGVLFQFVIVRLLKRRLGGPALVPRPLESRGRRSRPLRRIQPISGPMEPGGT